ncbi:MAG: hypothetical protein ACK4ZE_00065 [Sphingorhabdus sp.]
MAPSPQQLFFVLADELREMSVNLEALGQLLCSDPAVVSGHISALQQLDYIAQSQASIADIIAAEDPVSVCSEARHEHLKRHAR